MAIGQKIALLKDSKGFKNYQKFGEAVGVPGDWLNELSKKDEISTVDINRLLKISQYFNLSLDWFFIEDDKCIIEKPENLTEDDIGVMLNQIQDKVEMGNSKFYGYVVKKDLEDLIIESVNIVKEIIKTNL